MQKKSLDKKMCVGYKTEVDIRTCMEGQSGLWMWCTPERI